MKKILLFLLLYSTSFLFAQANNQIPDLQQCSPNGHATFDLTSTTPFALSGLDAANFEDFIFVIILIRILISE